MKNVETIIEDMNECLYFKDSLNPVLPVKTFIKYLQNNCYNCDGYDINCQKYLPMSALYKMVKK